MSNYTKATNFATKDALTSGNPLKTLSGTELDDEFNAIQAASVTKANTASAQLTGIPVAPTAASGTSTTQLATTAFVTAVDVLKAPLASPALTGIPVAPTAAADTSTTQLATTAFVTTEANLKADLASPTFTGVPAAPTAAADTSTTQLATTAFVTTEANLKADLAGAAFTGAITTTSTIDGVDIATRDGVLTTTTTTANAALPKSGGTLTGDVSHADNVKAKFGTGDDFSIHSGGTHTIFKNNNASGNVYFQTDTVVHFTNGANTEEHLTINDDGAVTLYHDNGVKLATTSTGVDVTGTVTADELDITEGTNARLITSDGIGEVGAGTFALQVTNSAGSVLKPMGFRAEDIRFATGSSERMRISDTGDVGIGTSSPTSYSGYSTLALNGTNGGIIEFQKNGVQQSRIANAGGAELQFATNNVEAMRILATGDVLVGKTAADVGVAGVELKPSGQIFATQSASHALLLNRTTSDGEILQFRKDGIPVGSIGAKDSDLFIGTTNGADQCYLRFAYSGNGIAPATASGSENDAALDLGKATGRFKDLYLSGGVYLGGTGAANKLDDYESGTWTPAVVGGTLTIATNVKSTYVKVGKSVTIQCYINLNNDGDTTQVKFSGLPFAAPTNGYALGVAVNGSGSDTLSNKIARIEANTSDVYIYKEASGGLQQGAIDGSYLIFTVTYEV